MNPILTEPWQGVIRLPRKRVVLLLVWLASVGAAWSVMAENNLLRVINKQRVSRAELPVVGQVSNENGEGVPSISVVLKGTTNGTTTDAEGNFRITVPGEESVLVFSFIGYQRQEIRVGKQTKLKVRMEPDTKQLNELVVGYAVQERKN